MGYAIDSSDTTCSNTFFLRGIAFLFLFRYIDLSFPQIPSSFLRYSCQLRVNIQRVERQVPGVPEPDFPRYPPLCLDPDTEDQKTTTFDHQDKDRQGIR